MTTNEITPQEIVDGNYSNGTRLKEDIRKLFKQSSHLSSNNVIAGKELFEGISEYGSHRPRDKHTADPMDVWQVAEIIDDEYDVFTFYESEKEIVYTG